jgi:hypothetical protein
MQHKERSNELEQENCWCRCCYHTRLQQMVVDSISYQRILFLHIRIPTESNLKLELYRSMQPCLALAPTTLHRSSGWSASTLATRATNWDHTWRSASARLPGDRSIAATVPWCDPFPGDRWIAASSEKKKMCRGIRPAACGRKGDATPVAARSSGIVWRSAGAGWGASPPGAPPRWR